jgi:hypothetical protein
LVDSEDDVTVTLTKQEGAVNKLHESYEKGGENANRKMLTFDEPHKYADERLQEDFNEIENTLAKDWAEEYLEYKNFKKDIKIVWAEE